MKCGYSVAHAGQLNFAGAKLANSTGPALSADGLIVDSDMYCSEGFEADGEMGLLGSHIAGLLVFTGAKLANSTGPALNADGLIVDSNMYCNEGFDAKGEVRLFGSHIASQ